MAALWRSRGKSCAGILLFPFFFFFFCQPQQYVYSIIHIYSNRPIRSAVMMEASPSLGPGPSRDELDLTDDQVQQLLIDAENRMKKASSTSDGSLMTVRVADSPQSLRAVPRFGWFALLLQMTKSLIYNRKHTGSTGRQFPAPLCPSEGGSCVG